MSLAGPAHGEEQPHARWVYEAPRGCPPPAEIDRALRARVPASALESDPRTFVIQIEEHDGSFVGRLTFSNDVGERVVEERTCDEVVEALVVFTTIALDPSRSPVQTERVAAALPPPSQPPPVASSSTGPRPEAPKLPPRGRLPATLDFGAGLGITSGPVPAPAPVFTLGATVRQPFSAERGVALRLGAKATGGEKEVSSGRLDAHLVAGQVEVAPTITWRSLSFSGGPGFTLGVLSATGQDISAARQSSALWADVGAVLRAGVGVGGIRFEGYVSGAAALTPRTYLLQRPFGERQVHATSPFLVAVGGEIALEQGRGF